MTGFWAPDRPRAGNGLPEWMTGEAVLPELSISPILPNGWSVNIMAPGERGFSWASTKVAGFAELEQLLLLWQDDPEGTAERIFGIKIEPRARARTFGPIETISAPTVSLSDLGL